MASLAKILDAPRTAKVVSSELTPRQLTVARLIAVGLQKKQIAEELSLSVKTVEKHVDDAYKTLGVSGAINLARKLILIDRLSWDEFMQPRFLYRQPHD